MLLQYGQKSFLTDRFGQAERTVPFIDTAGIILYSFEDNIPLLPDFRHAEGAPARLGYSQVVRQRTLTPSLPWFESRYPSHLTVIRLTDSGVFLLPARHRRLP